MPRSIEDTEALQNALLAIDTSIRTLVLAKHLIVERLEVPETTPYQTPNPTFGEQPELKNCPHHNTIQRSTMGQDWVMCDDCGEMVDNDE